MMRGRSSNNVTRLWQYRDEKSCRPHFFRRAVRWAQSVRFASSPCCASPPLRLLARSTRPRRWPPSITVRAPPPSRHRSAALCNGRHVQRVWRPHRHLAVVRVRGVRMREELGVEAHVAAATVEARRHSHLREVVRVVMLQAVRAQVHVVALSQHLVAFGGRREPRVVLLVVKWRWWQRIASSRRGAGGVHRRGRRTTSDAALRTARFAATLGDTSRANCSHIVRTSLTVRHELHCGLSATPTFCSLRMIGSVHPPLRLLTHC